MLNFNIPPKSQPIYKLTIRSMPIQVSSSDRNTMQTPSCGEVSHYPLLNKGKIMSYFH